MKVRKAKREYADVLNDIIKDLDGFKINAFDYGTINYHQRRTELWKRKNITGS